MATASNPLKMRANGLQDSASESKGVGFNIKETGKRISKRTDVSRNDSQNLLHNTASAPIQCVPNVGNGMGYPNESPKHVKPFNAQQSISAANIAQNSCWPFPHPTQEGNPHNYYIPVQNNAHQTYNPMMPPAYQQSAQSPRQYVSPPPNQELGLAQPPLIPNQMKIPAGNVPPPYNQAAYQYVQQPPSNVAQVMQPLLPSAIPTPAHIMQSVPDYDIISQNRPPPTYINPNEAPQVYMHNLQEMTPAVSATQEKLPPPNFPPSQQVMYPNTDLRSNYDYQQQYPTNQGGHQQQVSNYVDTLQAKNVMGNLEDPTACQN